MRLIFDSYSKIVLTFTILICSIIYVLAMKRTIKAVQRNTELIKVRIKSQSKTGSGLAYLGPEKMEFTIPNTLPGEELTALVTKRDLFRNRGTAQVVNLNKASKYRITPPCPIAEQCGGCQLQHQSYDNQLFFKRQQILDAFSQFPEAAKFSRLVEDVLGSLHTFSYRNKLQFAVQRQRDGRVSVGLYASNSNHAVDTHRCWIQHDAANRVLQEFKRFIDLHPGLVFDEQTRTGFIRHLVVRVGFHSNEVMACVVATAPEVPNLDLLVSGWSAIPEVTSVLLNRNEAPGDEVLGVDTRVLYGAETIRDCIAGVAVRVSLHSFLQSNPLQVETLYGRVRDCLGVADGGGTVKVWDLYCGVGTIGLFLSRSQCVSEVVGVESCLPAVEDARVNAKLSGVENIRFIHGKAEEVIVQHIGATSPTEDVSDTQSHSAVIREEDVVVLNPPRRGCHAALLEAVRVAGPNIVIYVSCNPFTLARDLQVLCADTWGGQGEGRARYEVSRVSPVDMFPQTKHVEVVVQLRRSGGII